MNAPAAPVRRLQPVLGSAVKASPDPSGWALCDSCSAHGPVAANRAPVAGARRGAASPHHSHEPPLSRRAGPRHAEHAPSPGEPGLEPASANPIAAGGEVFDPHRRGHIEPHAIADELIDALGVGVGQLPDRSCRRCARHRLADPPGGVGRELVAAAIVELLDRADQPQRALLDQVQERQAAAE